MTVVVLGSLNLDEVASVAALPVPGETVLARGSSRHAGGKGANQAVAAARAGARVRMVGAVGHDDAGAVLRGALRGSGVDVSGVRSIDGVSTGRALITVQDDGENTITVVPGANAELDASDVAAACDGLGPDDLLLLQLEVPAAVVRQAAAAAHAAGARVVLNAAPAGPVADLTRWLDVLVVNESEARSVLGPAAPAQDGVALAAAVAERHQVLTVVTLGPRGAACAAPGGRRPDVQPAPEVEAVDTTGAGDTFTGYLAAALSAGDDLPAAVELGVRAGACAAARAGAQDSIPLRREVAEAAP